MGHTNRLSSVRGVVVCAANLRAVQAENDILLSRSNAQASAAKIDAEGKKTALIIKSQAEAEARKIEADARNKAAQAMTDNFAKQFALTGQQVTTTSQ
jgi:regulator of protease activity HflC (stomatin/prohibitin superfamily)